MTIHNTFSFDGDTRIRCSTLADPAWDGDHQIYIESFPSGAGYSSVLIFVADAELAAELSDVLNRCRLAAIQKDTGAGK